VLYCNYTEFIHQNMLIKLCDKREQGCSFDAVLELIMSSIISSPSPKAAARFYGPDAQQSGKREPVLPLCGLKRGVVQ
jgi:hypothetical protein